MMAQSLISGKRNAQRGTKVKTGCATCRVRKIKCDESKPFCKRCVSTGRTCDGYESPFRDITAQLSNKAGTDCMNSVAGSQPLRPSFPEISPEDIDLLNRYFSTKTLFDVNLGCEEEARQVLEASLAHPPIQFAVSSLKALRGDLEASGDFPGFVVQPNSSYDYGIQQYCIALGALASNLTFPDSGRLKAALLCCQIFISIEQVRENYAAMAQHIIQGLRIMHEHRARPTFVAPNGIVPAHQGQLPFLDVFIIKLFAAPCKFADRPPTANIGGTAESLYLMSQNSQPAEPSDLRTIAPDMRTELTKISSSILKFLDKVSRVGLAETALRLLSEKVLLLESLESWLSALERSQAETTPLGVEPLSVSFLRCFHQILKIVLLGTLDYSPDLSVALRTEHEHLYTLGINISERVKVYRARSVTSSGHGERLEAR